MKKIVYLAIVVIAAAGLALPQVALGQSDAGGWASGTYDLGNGGVAAAANAEYELSSNVYLYYTPDNTNTSYVVGSLHKSGSRAYSTSNNTTLIYWFDKTTGATSLDAAGGSLTPGEETFSTGNAL